MESGKKEWCLIDTKKQQQEGDPEEDQSAFLKV